MDLYKLDKPERTPGFSVPEERFEEYRDRAGKKDFINRIDIYQLGNVLLHLLVGKTIDGIECRDIGSFEEKLSKVSNDSIRNLISKMLSCEVSERPSSEGVVKTLVKIVGKKLDCIYNLKLHNHVFGSKLVVETSIYGSVFYT